jgi:hypothetical protein
LGLTDPAILDLPNPPRDLLLELYLEASGERSEVKELNERSIALLSTGLPHSLNAKVSATEVEFGKSDNRS